MRSAQNAAYARYENELRKLEKDTRRIIDAIKSGYTNQKLKDELDHIVVREAELKQLMESAVEAPPMLHPSIAIRYRKEVNDLVQWSIAASRSSVSK